VKRVTIALLLLLITTAPALANFKDGIRAARKQDFATALREFKPLAEQGHSGAQFNMGVMYMHGRGVERNMVKALDLFFKSAEQGFPGAMNNLGRLFVEGKGVEKDFAEAVRWFRKAAKKHVIARNNLAQMYITGRGVEKDYAKALFWLKKAAKKKHAKSEFEIGIIYDNGLGVEKDPEEAIRWIRIAADRGYKKAITWFRRKDQEKRAEERKRRAESIVYHCPRIPEVSWWGKTSHASVVTEVSRKHQRKWATYERKWARHLKRMEKIRRQGKGVRMRRSSVDLSKREIRDPAAITEKFATLGGVDLDRYIVKVKQRITVHKCLAQEIAAGQAQKE